MQTFDAIYTLAAARKGDVEALLRDGHQPKTKKALNAIPDDRWLAAMTRSVFQAGFSWKVVENMWPGFEAAFDNFAIGPCAMLHDDDFARLVSDKRIIRNGQKIKSVQQNAAFLADLAAEAGSASAFFANWPTEDYIGLLARLKKDGSRLGGTSGQYFLRTMGVDSFILSRDVCARLVAEGVVDKVTSSKKSMDAIQAAFNTWAKESGRSLTDISRVLAFSIG